VKEFHKYTPGGKISKNGPRAWRCGTWRRGNASQRRGSWCQICIEVASKGHTWILRGSMTRHHDPRCREFLSPVLRVINMCVHHQLTGQEELAACGTPFNMCCTSAFQQLLSVDRSDIRVPAFSCCCTTHAHTCG
jgi:hypothetical protein